MGRFNFKDEDDFEKVRAAAESCIAVIWNMIKLKNAAARHSLEVLGYSLDSRDRADPPSTNVIVSFCLEKIKDLLISQICVYFFKKRTLRLSAERLWWFSSWGLLLGLRDRSREVPDRLAGVGIQDRPLPINDGIEDDKANSGADESDRGHVNDHFTFWKVPAVPGPDQQKDHSGYANDPEHPGLERSEPCAQEGTNHHESPFRFSACPAGSVETRRLFAGVVVGFSPRGNFAVRFPDSGADALSEGFRQKSSGFSPQFFPLLWIRHGAFHSIAPLFPPFANIPDSFCCLLVHLGRRVVELSDEPDDDTDKEDEEEGCYGFGHLVNLL